MIYLIRHTKPLVETGVCYGQTDLDISECFDDEVAIIKSKIILNDSFFFYSSPLQRCKKLAKSLSKSTTINFDDRLKELNFGDWENIPWSKLPQGLLKKWSANFVNNAPPKGESLQELSNRVLDFWDSLDHQNKNYIITAHDGVLRVVLAHLLDTPLKKAFTLKINYGEVIKINFFDSENCRIEFVGK